MCIQLEISYIFLKYFTYALDRSYILIITMYFMCEPFFRAKPTPFFFFIQILELLFY